MQLEECLPRARAIWKASMGKVGLEWALGRYIEVRPNDKILELVTLFQIIMVTPASHTLNAGTGMTVPLVQSSVTLMFERDGKGQVLRLEKKMRNSLYHSRPSKKNQDSTYKSKSMV